MEREIKFRGKSAGVWYSGHFFAYRNTGGGTGAHFIVLQEKEDENLKPIQVMPETVGQFTGLHDKNGKEIYEGDIVRFNQKFLIENILLVGYEYSHRGGFSLCTKEGYYGMFGDAWLEPFYCEVIGNIYDNPELLKGGKQ